MNHFTWRVAALAACLAASSLLEASPVQELREKPRAATLRLIVELEGTPRALARDARSATAADDVLARFRRDLRPGGAVQRDSDARDPIRREFRTAILGAAVEIHPAALNRLRQLPYVRAIHPDNEVRALASPARPRGQALLVDARPRVNAGGLGNGGAGRTVAVIDTGIDYTHPALGGAFGPGQKVTGGWDFVNDDADPIDDHGHGTHVAGTIAADSAEIVGVAPQATLLAYKVLGASGSGDMSDTIAAIERALDPDGNGDLSDHADVMNLSLGGPGTADDAVSQAVDNAVAAGAVVVVAAGNDGRIASIGSPGTAQRAITVAAIDDGGSVTDFSSRGPSPRSLGFKPDLAAPGLGIVSTLPGGGSAALNGTSMATPHVAGAAALLLNLHPDWTPDTLKVALVSSASPLPAIAFARGGGRADVQRANAVKLTADVSGLSFGIRPWKEGVTSSTQTFNVTNTTGQPQTLAIQPVSTPAGVEVTVTPASLNLSPDQTAEVSVFVHSNNAVLAFPQDMAVGGEILFSGSASLSVPWAFLRAARATLTFDGIASMVLALDKEGGREPVMFGLGDAEFYLAPAVRYDFLVQGYAIPETEGEPLDTRMTIVREEFLVDSDHLLEVRTGEATIELVPDARDDHGVPLAQRSGDAVAHTFGTRLFHPDKFVATYVDGRSRVARLLYSPLSPRWELHTFEQLVDGSTLQSFNVEHEVLYGVSASRALSSGGAELTHLPVAWRNPSAIDRPLVVCPADATTRSGLQYMAGCYEVDPAGATSMDHFTTVRRSPNSFTAVQFGYDHVMSPPFRFEGGSLVASFDAVASPLALTLPAGSPFVVGAGPSLPFALTGTRTGSWFTLPPYGFVGPAGEIAYEDEGTAWTAYDASGATRSGGIWRGGSRGDVPPPPVSGGRFVATRNDLRTLGRKSRGALEVQFGSNASDLNAPTLTAFRLVGSGGTPTDRLQPGESGAALVFGIADVDFARAAESKPSRPELTRAWYRVSGTGEWIPLSVGVTGSESGSLASLRHFPAGDVYRAALPPLSGAGTIDFRVEFEDAAGNRVRWTQELAAAVGEPLPRRGRAVR